MALLDEFAWVFLKFWNFRSHSRFSIETFKRSLEVNGSEWSGEVSEELRHSNGINHTCLVDIIVVPCIFISKTEEFLAFFTLEAEMSIENFNGSFSCGFLCQLECSGWSWIIFALINNWFNGVFLKHRFSESINWVGVNSNISSESLWNISLIWLEIITVLVLSTWDSVKSWSPSREWW